MPASSINLYHMQDAKNNFQALRPAPVCNDSNMFMGQCQNIHVSTNCYYGFHDPKNLGNISEDVDCEMIEVSHGEDTKATSSPQSNARKRSAEDCSYPKNKRLREGKIFNILLSEILLKLFIENWKRTKINEFILMI